MLLPSFYYYLAICVPDESVVLYCTSVPVSPSSPLNWVDMTRCPCCASNIWCVDKKSESKVYGWGRKVRNVRCPEMNTQGIYWWGRGKAQKTLKCGCVCPVQCAMMVTVPGEKGWMTFDRHVFSILFWTLPGTGFETFSPKFDLLWQFSHEIFTR